MVRERRANGEGRTARDRDGRRTTVRRRVLLRTAGAGLLATGLAGCSDEGLGTPGDTDTPAVNGTVTGTPGTGTGTPTGGVSPDQSEAPVVGQSTENTPPIPDDPREKPLPPEGGLETEEFERLKERAARGELPQPPASEIERDEDPQARFAGAANLDGVELQQSISVGTGFDGWNNGDLRVLPSDANLAVGPDHVVLAVNLRWGIYDKSSGTRRYEVLLEDWWSPVIDEDDVFVFDPKALYDHHADRYVIVAVGKNDSANESSWLVAVSDDANPFGTWWVTRIGLGDSDNWVDYPGFGLDQDAIYLTGNQYPFAGGGMDYSRLNILDKTPYYNGNSFTYWWFTDLENPDGSDAHTVQPTISMNSSDRQYLVNSKRTGGDTLTLWELRNPTSRPRLSKHELSVSSYSVPPNAEQPGTSNRLETVDARLFNAVYANGSVWTSHSISYDWNDDGNGNAIVKWYEIDAANRSVSQTRGWGRPGGYYYFPAVSTNAETSTMLVYNESGPNTNPRIEVAGRTPNHTQNSLEDVALVRRGEAAFASRRRWGDYNGIVVDPETLSYWTYSQYGLDSNNTSEWGTWAGEASL